MFPTAVAALTCIVAVVGLALSKGRSPASWGAASVAVFVVALLVSQLGVAGLIGTDTMFAEHGAALGMVTAALGPIAAMLGNLVLATRLLSLPRVLPDTGTRWWMWRIGDDAGEGGACTVQLGPTAIEGLRGSERWFTITYDQLAGVRIDGEALRLRSDDGAELRLTLDDDGPEDRPARIAALTRIERRILEAAEVSRAQ